MSDGFGLAHLKGEGCHVHPDDPDIGYWGDDERIYINQLCGYIKDHNLNMIKEFQTCRKPHLLRKAIEEGPLGGFAL